MALRDPSAYRRKHSATVALQVRPAYLHKITGNHCGTASPSGLAVNVDASTSRFRLSDERHAATYLCLCRGVSSGVADTEYQLRYTGGGKLLSPTKQPTVLYPRYHVLKSRRELHWLPIRFRIVDKLCMMMYNVHTGSSAGYVKEIQGCLIPVGYVHQPARTTNYPPFGIRFESGLLRMQALPHGSLYQIN